VVAGVLVSALEGMEAEFGTRPGDLLIHFGPSICGTCYEVGEDVFQALGLPYPGVPSPVDLRGYLGGQAVDAGVPGASISRSVWCTLCGDSPFFSHRGGQRGRHVAFVGIRPEAGR
jgi:copper oxidase (laccase) domain-containing protein